MSAGDVATVVSVVLTVILAVAGATWKIGSAIHKVWAELAELRAEIKASCVSRDDCAEHRGDLRREIALRTEATASRFSMPQPQGGGSSLPEV